VIADLVPNAMFVPLYILLLLELHHCVNNIQDIYCYKMHYSVLINTIYCFIYVVTWSRI